MITKKQNQNMTHNIYFDDVIDITEQKDAHEVFDHIADIAAMKVGFSTSLLSQRLNTDRNHKTASIGDGVAIPHTQVTGLKIPLTLLARLRRPVMLPHMPDTNPIDLICCVLSPKRIGPVHLLRISKTARLMRDPQLTDLMRETPDAMTLMNILNNPNGWVMAA